MNGKEEFDVSIIIPTQNRASELCATLESLVENLPENKRIQIIVVDNNSSDRTKEVVDDFMRKSNLPLNYEFEPRDGLHHARHRGAYKANGEILFFIDDDVSINDRWYQSLLDAYKQDSIGCVGGRILPDWEEKPPYWIDQIKSDYLSLLDYGDERLILSGRRGINGCNFSIRKELLFQVGGFNPDGFSSTDMQWFRGDGEVGLVKKVQNAGYDVMYIPEATLFHRIPPGRITLDYFCKRAYREGLSRAFSYARVFSNPHFSGILLTAIGALAYLYFSLIRVWSGLSSKLNQYKYLAILHYGQKLLIDPKLRDHVVKENFLDD